MDLDETQYQILHGKSIEEIMKTIDWRMFEYICSKILEENGWKTKKNFRFKTERRYEIDIVAERGDMVLLIDCKHWGERKGKTSQLRYSAIKQLERTKQWERVGFLDRIGPKPDTVTMIITWLEEGIKEEDGVWIVPVFKLNSFLLDIEKYVN